MKYPGEKARYKQNFEVFEKEMKRALIP